MIKKIACCFVFVFVIGCGDKTRMHETYVDLITLGKIKSARVVVVNPGEGLAKAGEFEIRSSRLAELSDCILVDSQPSNNHPLETGTVTAKAYGTLYISLIDGEDVSIDLCSPLFFWQGSRSVEDAFTSKMLMEFLVSEQLERERENRGHAP